MASVSVLLPVYNGERFLRPAIDSVLAQTHADVELLIVNDGSTDGTTAILESYAGPRVRIVRNERNMGLSAALNRGLALAGGDLIARQDADDVSEPERLARQVAVMAARPDVALLGTQATAIDEDGRRVGTVERSLEDTSIRWYALVDNPFIHTSVMFRRSAIQPGKSFDPAFDPFSQDWALWSAIMARHHVMNLGERLVRCRVLGSSIMGAVETDEADPAYRRRFEGIVKELVARNTRATFGDGVSDAEIALLSGFVLGLDAGSVPAFLDLFARLRREFERRHPDARRSGDFETTLARQYDALAYRVAPASRRIAWRIYANGLGQRPGIARRLSWSRAIALAVLGKRARRQLRQLRRRDVSSVSRPAHHER